MGLIIDGVSASDLILDGLSVSLYEGGSPPVKVWPTRETVQITLGNLYQARDQFWAALTARGLDYRTVTKIPFDIELVGTGSLRSMFQDCSALIHAPAMDTRNVTNMQEMFRNCSSLTYVPDMYTLQVDNMNNMFRGCSSLTDGNVRLIGRNPSWVNTLYMIDGSGLTREPFYDPSGGPTVPRVVTISTSVNEWRVGTQAGDVSMIQALTGVRHLVFSAPVICDRAINAGNKGSFAAGNRLEAGWVLAPVQYKDQLFTFTEIL